MFVTDSYRSILVCRLQGSVDGGPILDSAPDSPIARSSVFALR